MPTIYINFYSLPIVLKFVITSLCWTYIYNHTPTINLTPWLPFFTFVAAVHLSLHKLHTWMLYDINLFLYAYKCLLYLNCHINETSRLTKKPTIYWLTTKKLTIQTLLSSKRTNKTPTKISLFLINCKQNNPYPNASEERAVSRHIPLQALTFL